MAAAGSAGAQDLLEYINQTGVECLNELKTKTWANAIKQGYREQDISLESDTDEQLLLYIPFNSVVKISGLLISGPPENGPKVIRLFVNKPSLGFAEAESMEPAQALELTLADISGQGPVALKARVRSSFPIPRGHPHDSIC